MLPCDAKDLAGNLHITSMEEEQIIISMLEQRMTTNEEHVKMIVIHEGGCNSEEELIEVY